MDSSTSAAAAGEAAVPPEDDVCSVCHDRFRIPCQANCSHWFCGKSLPLPCLLSLFAPPRLAPLPSTGINLDVLSLLDPTARREIEQAAGHAELSATDLGLAASCSFLLPVDRKELCWFEVVKDSWVC